MTGCGLSRQRRCMGSQMPEYPHRPAFWSNRLVRLLQKSCAANVIGIESCWLVTCIAQVEDSKRYSGPVTYWNGQLLPVTGFQSWGRLDRARKKAVDAGWLHYTPGQNRQVGIYWTLVPNGIEATFDDSPLCDNITVIDANPLQNGAPNGDGVEIETLIERRLKRGSNGEPSIPTPEPNPSSCQDRFTDADLQTAEFILNRILDMQPNRKKPDLNKWADTIRLMRERDGRTDSEIRDLFTWCNQDPFWNTNILSPDKLRSKWDDLLLKRGTKLAAGTSTRSFKTEFDVLRNITKTLNWPDDRIEIQSKVSERAIHAAIAIDWKFSPNNFAAFTSRYQEAS